jgi:hypothetical protein
MFGNCIESIKNHSKLFYVKHNQVYEKNFMYKGINQYKLKHIFPA